MKHRSAYEIVLGVLALIGVAGAVILTLMTGHAALAFQNRLIAGAAKVVEIVVGKGTAVAALTPLLLKLLFFMTLALILWTLLLIKGTDRRSALVGGVAGVVITAVVLEALQFALPLRFPSIADCLWCIGFGVLVSFGLFLCQWAWDKFPALVNRETVLYVVFGVITTIVNILSFQVAANWLGAPALIANAIAWVLSVLVAYITNKLFVFQSHVRGFLALAKEVGLFFGARLLSFGVDELGIWLMVDVAHISGLVSKIAMNVIVLILNYIFSKWFIFANKKSSGIEE